MLLQRNVCGQHNLFRMLSVLITTKRKMTLFQNWTDWTLWLPKKKQGCYFFSLCIVCPQNNYHH